MKNIVTIFFLISTWNNILINNGVLGMLDGEGIIGGRETKHLEYPYVVSLQNANSVHQCGGGIIAEQYILTAAHCVIREEVSFVDFPLKIVAGVNDLYDTEVDTRVEVEVEKMYVSNLFNRSSIDSEDGDGLGRGDIAVLKLKSKLDIKGNLGLAILDLPNKIEGTDRYDSYANETAKLAGFGHSYVEVDYPSDDQIDYFGNSTGKLQQADVLIYENSDCSSIYGKVVLVSQICGAVKEHKDSTPQGSCHGDSGSPLVLGNRVVGVVSMVWPKCNSNKEPDYYTRVTSHLEFIRNAMDDVIEGMRGATAP